MNFVRRGPRYLFFKVKSPDLFCQKLSQKTKFKKLSFKKALRLAEEESVLVFLGSYQKENLRVEDSDSILYFPINSTILLSIILNDDELKQALVNIRAGPGQLLMRIPVKSRKIIEKIIDNYKAEEISILKGIDKGIVDSTIISFTEEPLKSNLKSLKKINNNILVNKERLLVFEELRRDVLRYITQSLENLQWVELKINIYDTDELYKLEYDRIITILSDLEAGLVLGESWIKDHAFALFSIKAYQIRFFTFLDPIEIKKILFAFEYDSEGRRLVDYDLFNKKNKISWSEILNDNKHHDRKKLAFQYREKILKDLSEDAKKRYFEIENEINDKS